MKETPLVTIVIDNYNYGKYISEAIESCLNQSYVKTEIIVVDDGSTDSSRQIIERYGKLVTPIFKNNGGQASAFNAGYKHAKGELIAFLDADDYFFEDKVKIVVDHFIKYPQYLMYYHPVVKLYQENGQLSDPTPKKGKTGSLAQLMRRSGGWYPFPPTSGLVFNKEKARLLFPIPEPELKICADAYLHNAACFAGEIHFIDKALSAYRIHSSNIWSNQNYLQGQAQKQRVMSLENNNRLLNIFLTNHGMQKIDLSHSLTYNYDKWLLEDKPISSVPRLILDSLTWPSIGIRGRLRYLKNIFLNSWQWS